jgi:hypothetical protein
MRLLCVSGSPVNLRRLRRYGCWIVMVHGQVPGGDQVDEHGAVGTATQVGQRRRAGRSATTPGLPIARLQNLRLSVSGHGLLSTYGEF